MCVCVYVYVGTGPGEMKHTCLLNTDVGPMTDQGVDTPNLQLGKPMDFIGVTYRSMGEGLLRGAR